MWMYKPTHLKNNIHWFSHPVARLWYMHVNRIFLGRTPWQKLQRSGEYQLIHLYFSSVWLTWHRKRRCQEERSLSAFSLTLLHDGDPNSSDWSGPTDMQICNVCLQTHQSHHIMIYGRQTCSGRKEMLPVGGRQRKLRTGIYISKKPNFY